MTVVATVIPQHAAVSSDDHGLRDDTQQDGLLGNNVGFETALEPTCCISEPLPGQFCVDEDAFDPGIIARRASLVEMDSLLKFWTM